MTAPDPEPAPETAPPGEASSDAAGAPRHRTHPITPLVTGWKIVVGIIAVLTAQNIARLLEDFTLQRALIGRDAAGRRPHRDPALGAQLVVHHLRGR